MAFFFLLYSDLCLTFSKFSASVAATESDKAQSNGTYNIAFLVHYKKGCVCKKWVQVDGSVHRFDKGVP
jgi:hypothetical protein